MNYGVIKSLIYLFILSKNYLLKNFIMENFIIIFLISTLINELFLRMKLLPSFTGDLHQKFSSIKSVPLTGGVILLVFNTFFF